MSLALNGADLSSARTPLAGLPSLSREVRCQGELMIRSSQQFLDGDLGALSNIIRLIRALLADADWVFEVIDDQVSRSESDDLGQLVLQESARPEPVKRILTLPRPSVYDKPT